MTPTEQPDTTTTQNDSPPAKITVRTDEDTRAQFKRACDWNHTTMQDALAQFVEAMITHAADRSVRHLDGSLCPLSQLIDGLARAALLQAKLPPPKHPSSASPPN